MKELTDFQKGLMTSIELENYENKMKEEAEIRKKGDIEEEEREKAYMLDYEKYIPISIICPTRHRCHGIHSFLESAYKTAWRFDTFEIIFICDNDDKATPPWIDICKDKFPELDISYYIRERTEFLNRDYFNYGAEKAKGKYFWNAGDDLIFILPQWDKAVFDYLDIFFKGRPCDNQPLLKDGIVYINIKCDTPKLPDIGYPYSCFPIISRKAVETLGFFLIPEIPSWCSDYVLGELYSRCNRFAAIPEQVFKHIGVETKSATGDKVTERLHEIMKKYNSPRLAGDWLLKKMPDYRRKIYEAITKAEEE